MMKSVVWKWERWIDCVNIVKNDELLSECRIEDEGEGEE